MTQTEKIRGRIIRIIDTRTIIVNLGKKDGITDSSVFHILGEPEEIIDPLTEEILGSVLVVKSKLKASQVFENFSIATTRWTIFQFARLLNNSFTDEVDYGELIVDQKELQPWKAQSETPVRVGDIVEVPIQTFFIEDPGESQEEE